jgi:hypothetical protein
VANHGPGGARAIQLTVQLPASAAVMSTMPSRGSCAVSTIVTCSLDALAAGGDVVVAIRVQPGAAGDIVAAARITADSVNDDPADNAATAVVTAEAPRRELLLRYPNEGGTIAAGRASAVQFTLRGVAGGVKVELSRDEGRTWTSLATNAPNTGFFDWVPAAGGSSLARVRVTSVEDARLSAASGSFTIR